MPALVIPWLLAYMCAASPTYSASASWRLILALGAIPCSLSLLGELVYEATKPAAVLSIQLTFYAYVCVGLLYERQIKKQEKGLNVPQAPGTDETDSTRPSMMVGGEQYKLIPLSPTRLGTFIIYHFFRFCRCTVLCRQFARLLLRMCPCSGPNLKTKATGRSC